MTRTPESTSPPHRERRGNRRKIEVSGRLTWRDGNGTLRFASVLTQDVSETDAFVVCQVPTSIPKYRLVHFQIERSALASEGLPDVLKRGKLLSAIFRVGPCESSTGTPKGYGIRLLAQETVRRSARSPLALAN